MIMLFEIVILYAVSKESVFPLKGNHNRRDLGVPVLCEDCTYDAQVCLV